MESTKEKILRQALICFANNGYKGTNLRELAAQVGLTKSALYRHFESKEAIWDAVLDRMEAYYSVRFGSAECVPEIASCEALREMTLRMLEFTLHDEQVILTRRVLLTEQFHDARACAFASEHFLNRTKALYAGIFARMMDRGLLRRGDPEMLAFAYTAPITALVHLHDREPDRAPEIMAQIEAFIAHFIATYAA